MKKVTIVIPCYFNELNLWKTYQVLKNDVLDKRVDINFEIICVDDGSKDRTLDILLEIQKVEKRLKVIKFSKNFGEFRAILAGLEKATGDCIAVMSADLQDPPHLITEMIKAWENGHKVVIAARSGRNEPWLKKQLAHTYYWFLRKLVLKDFPRYGFDFFFDRSPSLTNIG